MIDMVVHRHDMASTLTRLIDLMTGGRAPLGAQDGVPA